MPTESTHTMAKRRVSPQKPVGRPPRGAALVDGQWHATPETIALAVERLMAQRERVRKNRQATRELLRSYRPDLFERAKDATQTTLVSRADTPSHSLEQYRKQD